jgi:hypothetical protein
MLVFSLSSLCYYNHTYIPAALCANRYLQADALISQQIILRWITCGGFTVADRFYSKCMNSSRSWRSHYVEMCLYVCINNSGYSTQVLGVRSHCRLRDMRHLMESCQNATIIPCLPMLQVSTSLPKTSSFCSMTDSECVVTSGSVTVFTGQRWLYRTCFWIQIKSDLTGSYSVYW